MGHPQASAPDLLWSPPWQGGGRGVQGQWWPHPLHVTQQWHFASVVVQASSSSIPSCGTPHSHPLTVSLQPTAVLSPRLFSKLHGLASSPFAHLQAPYPGWGVQSCGTDLFLGSPLRAPKLLFCWLISLPVSSEWASLDAEPLLYFSFSPGVQVPSHFLFAFSFFHPTQLHRDLSCPFRCLRASAGVQLVLCEIYPCVDVFLMHLWGEVNSCPTVPPLSGLLNPHN